MKTWVGNPPRVCPEAHPCPELKGAVGGDFKGTFPSLARLVIPRAFDDGTGRWWNRTNGGSNGPMMPPGSWGRPIRRDPPGGRFPGGGPPPTSGRKHPRRREPPCRSFQTRRFPGPVRPWMIQRSRTPPFSRGDMFSAPPTIFFPGPILESGAFPQSWGRDRAWFRKGRGIAVGWPGRAPGQGPAEHNLGGPLYQPHASITTNLAKHGNNSGYFTGEHTHIEGAPRLWVRTPGWVLGPPPDTSSSQIGSPENQG